MDIVTDYIFKGLAVIASVIIIVGLILAIIETFKNRKIKKMVRTAEGARAYTKQYYEKLAPVSDEHKKILSKVVRDEMTLSKRIYRGLRKRGNDVLSIFLMHQ